MNSFIRVFHAAPNAPAVDVYGNGNPIVKNLAYKEVSSYLPLAPGSWNITVYPAGQTAKPVISMNLSVPENTVYTIAAIGTPPDISLYAIQEPTTAQNFGRPCVRFANLSPNAPAIDLKLSEGTRVFTNVSYKAVTSYACLPTGTYTFTINPTGSENIVLTVPNVALDANTYYTLYAVGLVGKSPALETVLLPEPR